MFKGHRLALVDVNHLAGACLICYSPLVLTMSVHSVCLQLANMLEGGGKTPLVPPEQLEPMGFKLVAYPLSLLGVSIRAMEDALRGLKQGQVPPVRDMGTFVDVQMAVGFPVSVHDLQLRCVG